MALGNKNYDANGKLFVLKIKTKNAEQQEVPPFFQISEKVDGKWTDTGNKQTSVSGILTNIESKESEINGDIVKSVSVFLKDKDETYLIDIRYSILGRGILNSLISLEDSSQEIEISLYQNKKGYASACVRANGEILSWKFKLDELPKPDEIKDKKGNLIKRDYSEIDEFFDNEVSELKSRLENTPKSKEKVEKKEKKAVEAKVEEVEVEGDDEPLFD